MRPVAGCLHKRFLMPAHDTSLRDAAGAIGFTPAGLKEFLLVTLTSPATAEQLDDWYVRHAEPTEAKEAALPFDDPKSAFSFLVEALPPDKRQELGRQILEAVARGYDISGKPYPDWLLELQELYEADQKASAAGGRRSAMGKYAHLNWSSEDYARRKQEEIDLEDGSAS
jgi:hypothetical protein